MENPLPLAMPLSAESSFIFSGPATDSSSNLASSGSTPPTTVADTDSLHSDASKHDVITVALDPEPPTPPKSLDVRAPSPSRVRRSRVSAPVYNLSKLSGTANHGKRRSRGDIITTRRRRTVGDALGSDDSVTASPRTRRLSRAAREALDASDSQKSPGASSTPRGQRLPSRTTGIALSPLTSKLASLSKRKRKATDDGPSRSTRELRRLQDTKEFAHVDERPVYHTVWSNGKFVDPKAPAPPPRKKAKTEVPVDEPQEDDSEPITNIRKRRAKKYLEKGLYAGQDAPLDMFKGLTPAEKKKLAQLPELIPSGRVNKTMPLPMYTGLRMLIAGRDFKLPYQVCNPLPPGQPKPDEWKKMTKNRFIGESKDYWRKSPHFHDMSKCVCKPEDGCGESCQNRIMLYECDETNCNVGKDLCTNRAFATLTARRAKGGKYRVGVEVIKTSDRGYGVRSNRCFRPNQIIMEYAGEIITEEECERRMNEVYKDNECYYLMSFDQNMIIDATTGSIARFVNHSCNPNCRMIKWIVSGQPRMALFAGDRPIMTGDELTYDYNFDPFSAKNVQKCLCGSDNCRGVLGPKSREAKPVKADMKIKAAVKATVKAGKRKLKDLVGDKASGGSTPKKRKIQKVKATGVKRSVSKTSAKVVKGATSIRKKVSAITTTKKRKTTAVIAKKSPAKKRAGAKAVVRKTTTKSVVTTYGKKALPKKKATSTSSSLTIVAKGDAGDLARKTAPPAKKVGTGKRIIIHSMKAAANLAKKADGEVSLHVTGVQQ